MLSATQALLLDAQMQLGLARRRLSDSTLSLVVLRRALGSDVYWYAYTRTELLEQIGRAHV